MQNRSFIPGVLAALMICLAAGLAQADRPESGTFIKESDMTDQCQLDIINNASDDLVAYLCTMREEAIRAAVYIRGGDTFNLTGVDDGSYYLYFRQERLERQPGGLRHQCQQQPHEGTSPLPDHKDGG